MDNPLGHEAALNLEEIDYAADDSAIEAPPEIGNDERRLHVRAYNHWASLLKDRSFPSIEDLEPADIEDFGPHSVLLDFTAGMENPAVAFMGSEMGRANVSTPCTNAHFVCRLLLEKKKHNELPQKR